MKVGDYVFFAPGIHFRDLDLDGSRLPEQYGVRIEGYYLTPAQRAVEASDAFAAGLLAFAAIDAISRIYYGPNRSKRMGGSDFRSFAQQRLKSFSEATNADILYEKYRNGLVHEARLKEGCQFEIGCSRTIDTSGPTPIIDPGRLVDEVRISLKQIVSEMEVSQQFRDQFARCLREEFKFELA